MSDLARWLDRQLEKTAPPAQLRRSFGARDLDLRGTSDDELHELSWALGEPRFVDDVVEYRVLGDALRSAPVPRASECGPYGVISTLGGTGWRACIDVDNGRLLALHREARVALSSSLTEEPPRHQAEFARTLLHWLAIDAGHLLVHAGAVGRSGRAVLVVGPGGAGKSTFVRCAAGAGATFLGDNAIEVAVAGDRVTAWGAYGSLKVRPPMAMAEALALEFRAHDVDIAKDLYDLRNYSALGITHEAVAVVAASADGPLSPEPMSRGAALFSVAPSTMVQFPLYGPEVFETCGDLVRALDCFSLGRLDSVADHGRVLDELLGS